MLNDEDDLLALDEPPFLKKMLDGVVPKRTLHDFEAELMNPIDYFIFDLFGFIGVNKFFDDTDTVTVKRKEFDIFYNKVG